MPGLQHALGRMLAGMVLVDSGWRTAMELALDQPDLVLLTRGGDRLGGDGPWRIGDDAATVTQAAFEEAVAQVGVVEAERADADSPGRACTRRARRRARPPPSCSRSSTGAR